MATGKGVIQGYTAVAAVDSSHQVIVAAVAHGSGSEQSTLLPTVELTDPVRNATTLITADAGYHSEANLQGLHDQGIPALVADNLMRRRDERFANQAKYQQDPDPLADKSAAGKAANLFGPKDFTHDKTNNTCICPAGQHLYSNGSHCVTRGRVSHKFTGTKSGCGQCLIRNQCLRHPERTLVRQVSFFAKDQPSPHQFTERMKQAIDSPRGRKLYSQRMATVEPVFANLRHNKQLNRFTLRTQPKVNTQWTLYCLVHNIEKLAKAGFAQ
jgi:Transposase DDE domain